MEYYSNVTGRYEKFTLPANTKRAWLAHLREPGRQQTTSVLCDVDVNGKKSYCCLGVLAEQKRLLRVDTIEKGILYVEDSARMEGKNFSYLPAAIIPEEVQQRLSTMNDSDRKSFSEIADWIEDNL